MLRIEPQTKRHLVVRSDEPMRVEIKASPDGHLVVYGYTGTDDHPHQEPTVLFDSHDVVEPV